LISYRIKYDLLFNLAKRLSEKEKTVLVKCFTEGKSINELAEEFDCAKLTITRNLKRNLGNEKYKELINQSKTIKKSIDIEEKKDSFENNYKSIKNDYLEGEFQPITPFFEITPLECEIENDIQKDYSSVPISKIEFPNTAYMIVNKKIELETKYLKEYPEWQFLSNEELNRKTIEIYIDLKVAKRSCNKEQKVIKVTNTDVFKIVAPILISRGISRIVSPDNLIAL
tara:strand:- start:207 stop:887 length:681 start_codon:yes stop_codon:yes gene_type:complete